MAQTTCQKCGNPFATSFKCSNCGQYPKNVTLTPSEKSFGSRIIGYIFFIALFFGIISALGFDADSFGLVFLIGLVVIIWSFVSKRNKKR